MCNFVEEVSDHSEAYLIAGPVALSHLFNAVDKALIQPQGMCLSRTCNT